MKHPSKLLLISGIAFMATVALLASESGWRATLMGFLVVEKTATHVAQGQGGMAIRAEDAARVHLDNQGLVRAGSGALGGSGGDAIHVANDAHVTIINRGVIAGGNAGILPPNYEGK